MGAGEKPKPGRLGATTWKAGREELGGFWGCKVMVCGGAGTYGEAGNDVRDFHETTWPSMDEEEGNCVRTI